MASTYLSESGELLFTDTLSLGAPGTEGAPFGHV